MFGCSIRLNAQKLQQFIWIFDLDKPKARFSIKLLMQVVNYRLIISFWLYWIDIIYEEELICKFFVLFFGRNHNNMRGSFLPRENYLGIAYDKKFDWKIVLTLQSNLKSFSHVSILRFFLNCITILIWECFFKVFRNFGRIELRGKCPRMFLEFFFSFSSDFNFPAFAFPLLSVVPKMVFF